MCRYGLSGPYKNHFACFECRKAFKQPDISDWLNARDRGYAYRRLSPYWSTDKFRTPIEEELGVTVAELHEEYKSATHRCPECGTPMIDMGMDFKTPPQADVKAWQRFRGMYRVGHAFHTCGCDGPGYIPQSTNDFIEYLNDRRRTYAERLKQSQRATDRSPEDRVDEAEYWSERIRIIDRELVATR